MAKKSRKNPKKTPKVVVTENGPYLVYGSLPLSKEIMASDRSGIPVKWVKGERYPKKEVYALCRCGRSKSPPYCTGKHAEIGFDGTETASRKKYLAQAEKISGPGLVLTDAYDLCAVARFCDKGAGVWELTKNSGKPASKKLAVKEACNCPAGRLVAWDKKTGKPIEPKLKPAISLVEDPGESVSGPIWVKGGVIIESSDGTRYETRNRVTLCRCGKSGNKPFCDGTHIPARFRDGDRTLAKRK